MKHHSCFFLFFDIVGSLEDNSLFCVLVLKELEEEQRKLTLLKLTEEAEQKRLATELKERRRHRIHRGIEEKVTKQTVMEKAMSEKRKEDQEMEKKLQKLAKTMDYLERAKREEASPMIEAAYQQRLVEERKIYEHGQQVNFILIVVMHLYILVLSLGEKCPYSLLCFV